MPPAVLIGDLCRALNDARDARYIAERSVEDLLLEVLPAWRIRFPRHLSWLWTPPNAIDVFEVEATVPAVEALRLAGFTSIRIHPHPAANFLSCSCPTQET